MQEEGIGQFLGIAIQAATLVSVLVAIAGLGLGIRTYRRQTNAQIFIEYTARYERIMSDFTQASLSARLDLEGAPPAESPEVTATALKYLNMCSEEYYLRRRGYLSTDVWRIWEKELKRTLRSPLYRREWKVLKREFDAYSEFARYVDRVQAQSEVD